MRKVSLIFAVLVLSAVALGQTLDDGTDLEQALSAETNAEKIELLRKFIVDHASSELLLRAKESLVVARAAAADEKLRSGEPSAAVELFKTAIAESPEPISDKLFTEVISRFPANLFWSGQRPAAFEVAAAIEQKAAENPAQLQNLAAFFLGIEDGANAKRLAQSAIAADPEFAAGYQTLGMANRMNFDFEAATEAYAEAVALNPRSISARKSLAEMKRAVGKSDEAVSLYNEILVDDPADVSARTGLTLSLFNSGKRTEAESEMAKLLENDRTNLLLLSGSAYWYAANGDGAKAVELAKEAIAIEPRYIWSHIALGRGMMVQNDPVGAERILIAARRYANFPTLEYEIASARMRSGFYREAAEELAKSFTVKDGRVGTRLGRRIERESENFSDLVGFERRASMFEPSSAGTKTEADLMKALMDLHQNVASGSEDQAIASSVSAFTNGDDGMKLHRQLYAADLLLDKNLALPVVKELTDLAIGQTDAALKVAAPSAAVMASELYERRIIAFARDEFILVPEVPRQMLSAILRGRVEDLAGRTFFQQRNYPDAAIRLRRAISVLPEKSSWWRSSLWRLGLTLEAEGKNEEALKAYVQSYTSAEPDIAKYAVVERLYAKVYGKANGLDRLIGPNPLTAVNVEPQSVPTEPAERENEGEVAETLIAAPEAVPLVQAVQPERTTMSRNVPKVVPVKKETSSPLENVIVADSSQQVAEKVDEGSPSALETPLILIPETAELVPPEMTVAETNDDPMPLAAEQPKTGDTEIKTEPLVATAEPMEMPVVVVVEPKKTMDNDQNMTDVSVEISTPKLPESAIVQTVSPEPEALFKSIIIEVPKTIRSKQADVPAPEKIQEPEPATADDNKTADEMPVPGVQTETAEQTGTTRLRVVAGKEIREERSTACSITASQDNVSILNDGGSLGVLIGAEGGLIQDMTAESSNPDDVAVTVEPEIGVVANRRFVVIRSVSERTGLYQVKFTTGCGERTIEVRVR